MCGWMDGWMNGKGGTKEREEGKGRKGRGSCLPSKLLFPFILSVMVSDTPPPPHSFLTHPLLTWYITPTMVSCVVTCLCVVHPSAG